MSDLTAPSELMALLDINFDETMPTRGVRSVAARGQVRLQNIEAPG